MSIGRSRLLAGVVFGAAALAVPSSALAASAPGSPGGSPGRSPHARPLEILLADDDGYSAPGIQAVRQALVAAGHHVTVVAPATDQSGVGTAMTARFGAQIKARQESPGVWSVGGTPTDSVLFGLQVVFAGRTPDLVVSGSNFGQNTGALATHSGTVGAALAGLENGIPSIAVSTELDLKAGQDATIKAFPATARYLADLIARLQRAGHGGRVLPPGVALNVNYPIAAGEPRGTRVTRLGKTSFVLPKYQPAGPDTYVVAPDFPTAPEPVRNADTTALARDYVTVTPMDGDWTLSSARVPGLSG
jgi:5'-nucleotidase